MFIKPRHLTPVVLYLSFGGEALAAVYTVDKTVDSNLGSCTSAPNDCPLRRAITLANQAGSGTIVLQSGATYSLTIAPSGSNTNASGDLNILGSVVINANGAWIDAWAIDDRVMRVKSGGSLTLNSGYIAGGSTVVKGGGILNEGTLTLSSSWVLYNTATDFGGGVLSAGTLVVTNGGINFNTSEGEGGGAHLTGTSVFNGVLLYGNEAEFGGGGIYVHGGDFSFVNSYLTANSSVRTGGGLYALPGLFEVVGGRIESNSADDDGGGVLLACGGDPGEGCFGQPWASTISFDSVVFTENSGSDGGGLAWICGSEACAEPSVSRSLFLGNEAHGLKGDGNGGGISASGSTISISNTTFTGNYAAFAGGAISADAATCDHCTISGNTAFAVDGIYAWAGGAVSLRASVLGDLCGAYSGGNLESRGFNVDYASICLWTETVSTDVTDMVPFLGALADNGGPTWTMRLHQDSPQDFVPSGCPATDQRGSGYGRPSTCDAGAYERNPVP